MDSEGIFSHRGHPDMFKYSICNTYSEYEEIPLFSRDIIMNMTKFFIGVFPRI